MRNLINAVAMCGALAVLLSAARAATNAVSMSTNIAAGATSVTANWAALVAVPDKVLVSISAPATNGVGSFLIFGTPVVATLTASGAVVELSGRTDTTGYVAHISVWE